MAKLKSKIGESKLNRYGYKMTIIEYNNYDDITVEFEDGSTTHTAYHNFKRGGVKNPNGKTIYGVGFLGIGNYNTETIKGKNKIYAIWKSILQRCVSDKSKIISPSYTGCTVCEEWHNFQNFAKWYDENYYEIDGVRMNVDKDILVKGNKVYSPETCIIVPDFINLLFITKKSCRGKYLIGVSKYDNRFKAHIGNVIGSKHIGSFKTEHEAFLAYKNAKENIINDIANKYIDIIPKKLYDALIAYKVEEND